MKPETQQRIAESLQKLEAASAELNSVFTLCVLPADDITREHYKSIIASKQTRLTELARKYDELEAAHVDLQKKHVAAVAELEEAQRRPVISADIALMCSAQKKLLRKLESDIAHKDGQIAELRSMCRTTT
jgi:predicted RNase H-like nuclease (RuvC/YqgF family)